MLGGKQPVSARTKALCQPLRPPDAEPEDAFDYRKAHWERSKATELGLWAQDEAAQSVPEADVIDDRLLSLCGSPLFCRDTQHCTSACRGERLLALV